MPSANRSAMRGEQLVARARRGERAGDRGLRRRGAQPERPGEGEDLRAAGQLLEAARVAAAYVAHERCAGNRQEADLPGATRGAAVDAAVDDDRGAEALVGPEQHEVVHAAREPGPHLGDRDQVDVVVHEQRHPDLVGELVEQVGVVPAGQVPGVPQPAVHRVEGARGADGEPVQPAAGDPGGGGGAVDRVQDMGDRVGAGPARRRQLVLAHGPAGDVGDGGQDPGRRDVEGDDVGGVRVDGVQLGARPRTAVRVAAGDDQAGVGQPGQQLSGGGLGQPGELAEPAT